MPCLIRRLLRQTMKKSLIKAEYLLIKIFSYFFLNSFLIFEKKIKMFFVICMNCFSGAKFMQIINFKKIRDNARNKIFLITCSQGNNRTLEKERKKSLRKQ
ncbi:hypothetical protein BpHYR1_004284 [Brachionus plicatilis]|uniref:Uncharacterized protein n=1 Tax=Brachionus plicatilis TaxID=10195 RepID=A0A3M7PC60_BRAPC|nr:hypothetical protein BpHYR1_004284 [Brachionus plicatilis]